MSPPRHLPTPLLPQRVQTATATGVPCMTPRRCIATDTRFTHTYRRLPPVSRDRPDGSHLRPAGEGAPAVENGHAIVDRRRERSLAIHARSHIALTPCHTR